MSDATRRTLLKTAAGVAGLAALVKALSPLRSGAAEEVGGSPLSQHYKRLSPEDVQEIIARLEERARREHGIEVTIEDHRPLPGVEYGYAINLSLCDGNRKCVEACHRENNIDRATGESYIRVLEVDRGTLNLANSTTTYEHDVPAPGKIYLPIQCMQCRNPPCVQACPVEATWQQEDGITVTDYDWCIGCRYCEVACPYHARRFNWAEPEVPPEEINPVQGYLSNRIRPKGVDEKCHLCLHRVREGRLPACLEACPTGARIFGNLLDPESPIRRVLETKNPFVLKAEAGTDPRFYYFFDE